MSKLIVTGKAAKEYTYDQVRLTVCFQVRGKSSSETMGKALKQCEQFLGILKDRGVNLKNVHQSEDTIDQNYRDGKLEVIATREVSIRLPYDLPSVNTLLSTIAEQPFNVDVDTEYEFSNLAEIRNELIKLAIQDSKEKADFIADLTGQKIIGIDSIEINDGIADASVKWLAQEQNNIGCAPSDLGNSDAIGRNFSKKKADVEVVWLIE